MSDKKSALDQIAAIADEHSLSIDDIAGRLTHGKSKKKDKVTINKLFGYMGGIFIFSGIALLMSMIWEDVSSAQRVIITLGSGIAAMILSVSSTKDVRYEKAATPLALISACMQPTGIFVFLNEFIPDAGDPELAATIVFAVLAIQQGLLFKKYRRTSLIFFTLCFWNGAIGSAMAWLDMDGAIIGFLIGVSMISVSYAVDKTEHRAITPFWYFCASFITLVSYFDMIEDMPILDLSYLGLCGFIIYLSIKLASRAMLFVSVLGMFAFMSYFAGVYFADVIGWPLCLIALGLIMIGMGTHAVKLGQKIRNTGAG